LTPDITDSYDALVAEDMPMVICKFWLDPVALAHNNGFSAKELTRIRKIIVENLERLREAWNEHCGEE
jgi:hypothetical protein